MHVTIQGSGVAACACARLLQRNHHSVAWLPFIQEGGPALLLNHATQKLLSDILDVSPQFFVGLHRVSRRIVLWGTEAPLELVHSGAVIQEAALLATLRERVAAAAEPSGEAATFHIHTIAGRRDATVHSFGSRLAYSAAVDIRARASDACWVEALEDGWLFLIPQGPMSGSLLAVGGTPAELIAKSRLIGDETLALSETKHNIPVAPRIAQPLATATSLACGSAAMTFDPICGEGVGNAVREALLACACITHPEPESALADYAPRLMLGFLKHLELCRRFYTTGPQSDWWKHQTADLETGLAWTRQQLANARPPQYRMVDLRLESIAR